jgi:cytidine deaminase
MLTEDKRNQLIQSAIEARQKAYAPYSNYAVGAALLTSSGNVYQGVNIENAAYPASICAERSAVFNAVINGERQFTAIAVATLNAGMPCGSCRQVLAEFGLDTLVLISDLEGRLIRETDVASLLPDAFTPDDLVSG